LRLYIAGPYGDKNPKDTIRENVKRADDWARHLVTIGHQVYCPHKMSWGWEDDAKLNGLLFQTLDVSFLEHWAEGLVRLPGVSKGSDFEVVTATQLGLPVYFLPDKVPEHKVQTITASGIIQRPADITYFKIGRNLE